jgi:integrase
MAPTLARPPLHCAGRVYAEKVDGWRMLAYKDGARLISRNAVDHTARFRELAWAIAKLRPDVLVLDGEVAVFDEDLVSRFHLLGEPDSAILCTPPMFIAFDVLQVACAIAYTFGWRMRSEVLALGRRHVDVDAGTLRLDPGMTKNGDAGVIYLTPELKAALVAQLARVEALQKKLGRVIPWLFPHVRGRHKGQQRRRFRKAWASACTAVGEPRMLKHDFRRTAVRNMERSCVPRSVATKLTGHKTEAVSALRDCERC